MGKLSSWLVREPVGGIWPTMDKCVIFILRIFYLTIRAFLWIFLNRKRRDQSNILVGLSGIINFSPSFSIFRFLYEAKKFLGLDNPALLKISVKKYGYKVYCPISIHKDDLINMTVSEEDILDRFQPRRGDTVVDIGAHIGRYSIIASKRAGFDGKVVAFEANPSNYEILNNNITLNQLTNIRSLNYAVYSKEAKIKLFLSGGGTGQTIYNTIMTDRANKGQEKFVQVRANTLDNLLKSLGIIKVNWIKIDVEGAEYEVLKGAHSILSNSKDISILIEIHNLDGSTNLYNRIIEFLASYNFKVEFEKNYESGEKHIIVKKQCS